MSTSARPVPLTAVPAPRGEDRHVCPTGALLAAHVPLTLLLDLAEPAGPRSQEILVGEPGDAGWLS